MRIGDWKIGVRLGGCFGLLILFALIISVMDIDNIQSLSELTDKLYRDPYAVSTATLRIDRTIVKMHRAMKDVALAKNAAGIDAAAGTVAGFEQEAYKDFDLINDRFVGNKRQVEAARKLFADWKPIRDEVLAFMRTGAGQEAADVTQGKGAAHVQALNKAIGDLLESAQGRADGFVKNAAAARDRALLIAYVMIGLVILAGVVLAVFMTRSITLPMKHAVSVSNSIAANDLTVRIATGRRDETGQLLASMKKMVDNLSGTISINASAAMSLSEAASEQAAALEESSSSLEEMASMTSQNADNANEANNIVKKTSQDMHTANDAMSKLTTSMADITQASEETSKIIKTIDEIAFQTNLLALNAAVEAARAGEAGAGFAVVADEVRNLAMRAAEAARNTADLIEGTVKKVKDGSELVNKTNEAFTEVAAGSAKVGELVAEIAAASKEQADGVEQVNKAVAEMDRVVQANAANAEEMAASMAVFKVSGKASTGPGGTVQKRAVSPKKADPPRAKKLPAPSSRALTPEEVIPLDDDFADF